MPEMSLMSSGYRALEMEIQSLYADLNEEMVVNICNEIRKIVSGKVGLMKVLFLKGNSAYGALRVYSDMYIEEIRRRGHQVDVVDRQVPGEWENAVTIEINSYDMVIGYAMLPFKLKVLCEKANVDTGNTKFVAFSGDHPIYINHWLKVVKEFSDNLLLLLDDEMHLECIRKRYPWIKAAAFKEQLGDGLSEVKAYNDRNIEVFFGGSYYNEEEEMSNIEQMPERMKNLAKKIIRKILANEGMPLQTSLEVCLKDVGICMKDDEFVNLMEQFVPVDKYIRGYYRNMYLEAALEADAKVCVYGNGWEKCKFVGVNNFTVLKGQPTMLQGHKFMADSKIVLNIMPWSRIGMHERICNALIAGAVCVTNTNEFIEEKYGKENGIRGFGLNNKQEITDDIRWLLDHQDEAAKMAAIGRKRILKENSISKYYDRVWQCLEEIMYKTL